MRLLIIIALLGVQLAAQTAVDTYYSGVNVSSASFITNLQTTIRSPYTRIIYEQFDETNVANFASRDTTYSRKVVTCVYSGLNYVYTPPFKWYGTVGVNVDSSFSREHSWCQSWMPTKDTVGFENRAEYSDQHHLFPTNQKYANGVRNNHPEGIVTTVTSSYLLCKYGQNAAGETVFEPRNSHKGDFARALLYMSVRYNGINGYDWTFNHLNAVTLPDSLHEAPQDLSLLLQWSKDDPPDAWETARNNYIETVQGNRNPFVDHPEWVNYINFNDLTKLTPTYSVEPTNYVTNLAVGNLSTSSFDITWTNAVMGTQAPSGYLLEIFSGNDDYFIPADGSSYADDTDLSDTRGVVNITNSGTITYSFSGLTAGATYYIRVFSYNGTTTSTNYKIDGTVPYTSATVLSGSLATEPTNYVSNFSTSNATASAIQLNWTDAAVGTQVPAGYLIIASTSSSIANPSDGVTYVNDLDLSNGLGKVNVDYSAADSYTFFNLTGNTRYYFKIFSYYGTGSAINYKTDGTVPAVNDSTLSILNAGDILIIGFNMDDPDEFAFIPLVDLPAGIIINFTDNGWLSTGSLKTGEGILVWTAPVGGVTTGTIVNVSSATPSIGSIVSSGSFLLSASGDQILAYTGTSSIPNFIYAVNDSGSSWQATALSANSSALPAGLANGVSAVALNEIDNAIFSGTISSDHTQLQIDVGNKLNWTGSNSVRQSMPSGVWALPVELESFNAYCNSGRVSLTWRTATEVNNYGFEVERLQNYKITKLQDRNWEKVGFVNGAGNSNSPKEYRFTDNSSTVGRYLYRLKQIDNDGKFAYSKEVEVEVSTPLDFALEQNYPNPFNPVTRIQYAVGRQQNVSLKVYDVLGKEVALLVNEKQEPGVYNYELGIRNYELSSGIYFYQLQAGAFVQTKKMVILK
ncbi:MAG: endonuclease [Ignavibacteriaceae bacterium]|jgi:endonuclease I